MYEHFKFYRRSGHNSGVVNIDIIAYLLKAFDYCIYVVEKYDLMEKEENIYNFSYYGICS